MKRYSDIIKSLENDANLHELTQNELSQLHSILLRAFNDIYEICNKYDISVMLIGGSALGAVRHRGFIPWDDDLDVAMTREDFTHFKGIFEKELGDKYILCAPNFKNSAKNRFPQILIKNTSRVSVGGMSTDKIKIDLFIIENIPNNKAIRLIRGMICSALMYIASQVDKCEKADKYYKEYLLKNKEGRRYYRKMRFFGAIFSFVSYQKWYDLTDELCNYKKETDYMGIPTGRKHYFGEICSKNTFIPCSEGIFEGKKVWLPHDVNSYLTNLYGNYAEIPPKEKREKHYIISIKFDSN